MQANERASNVAPGPAGRATTDAPSASPRPRRERLLIGTLLAPCADRLRERQHEPRDLYAATGHDERNGSHLAWSIPLDTDATTPVVDAATRPGVSTSVSTLAVFALGA